MWSRTNVAQRFMFRYAFPRWREKDIVSEERRSLGLCPLTPEETTLVLRALGFDEKTQIYIASGEIYGNERRLAVLRASFPHIVSNYYYLWDWPCESRICEFAAF